MAGFVIKNALDFGRNGEVIHLWGNDISTSFLQLTTSFGSGT